MITDNIPAAERAAFLADCGPELAILKLRAARNWAPRGYQRPLWDYLQNGGRRAIQIWHRQSGKDTLALNWTAEALHRRVGEYWHMLPEAAQARKAIWNSTQRQSRAAPPFGALIRHSRSSFGRRRAIRI